MPYKKIILAICSLAWSVMTLAHPGIEQPSTQALASALNGYQLALDQHKVKNMRYMGIVDFTKPSYQQRFYVYDLNKHQAIYDTLVAQGKRTGYGAYAKHFSNVSGSNMSSLGTFVTTGAHYASLHGRAIHVEGLQAGLNSNAGPRAVEIHSAWYVNPTYAAQHHRVGNSLGCFAVSKPALRVISRDIGDGSVVYAYYS